MTTIPITGRDLRNQGIESALAADVAPHREAAPFIRESVQAFADLGKEFTSDDVRDALRANKTVVRALADRPNLLPAVFGTAAKEGVIRAVGYTRTSRPSRRASVLRIWQGVTA